MKMQSLPVWGWNQMLRDRGCIMAIMDVQKNYLTKTSILEEFADSSADIYSSTDGAELYLGATVCLIGLVLDVSACWAIIYNW